MQLSNTAAPTQSEGAVCQWPLIQKNSFKEAAARLHLLQEIADAIVPTSHQGTAHSVPLSSESQDMNYLKTVTATDSQPSAALSIPETWLRRI